MRAWFNRSSHDAFLFASNQRNTKQNIPHYLKEFVWHVSLAFTQIMQSDLHMPISDFMLYVGIVCIFLMWFVSCLSKITLALYWGRKDGKRNVCANYPLIIKVNKTSGQLTFGPVQPQVGGGGKYSLIWPIWVCAAPTGMVLQQFWP